jgi:hypothetical protein
LKEGLQPNFVIGNIATDLVELTLDLCNKDENHTPRFPKRMYDSYIKRIMDLTLDIQCDVCEANSIKIDRSHRCELQEDALGKCVSLEKLVFVTFKKGWISEKQLIKWTELICNLHWKIYNWMKVWFI